MSREQSARAVDRDFVEYGDAHALLRELQAGLDRLKSGEGQKAEAERLLPRYHELLRMRDRTFPLLMREGEPFTLDREPVHLYLLPVVDKDPGCRWLLCQYPRTYDQLPKVQILCWRLDGGKSFVEPMPGCSELDVEDRPEPKNDATTVSRLSKESVPKLDRRAKTLRVDDLEYTVLIRLELDEGQLRIMADPDLGLTSVKWLAPGTGTVVREERRSADEKEPVLLVSRESGTGWQNDSLKIVGGDRIDAPGIGRLRAVGGANRCPDLLYVGGSKAQVFRIDLSEKKTNAESSVLRGGIHDLLVVNHPEREGSYAILVAVTNGMVYLMEDGDGTGKEIFIKRFQKPGRPIVRLFGRDGCHVLARDRHSNLIPLRIVDPRQFLGLCNSLTDLLYETLEVGDYLNACCNGTEKPEADACPIGRLTHLARLALEHYLRHFLDENGPLNPISFAAFCQELGFRYRGLTGEALRSWALLHLELLERVWGVMRDDCARDPSQMKDGFYWKSSVDPERFEFLWSLLQFHSRAPDWLLLRMLRDSDRLQLWLRHRRFLTSTSPHRDYLERQLRLLGSAASAARVRLVAPSRALRGIVVQASRRFLGPVKHLRVIDEGRHRVAFVEIGFGLRVMGLNGSGDGWSEVLASRNQELSLRGLITTLAAGPELEIAVGGDAREPSHLFLATDEGELSLLRLDWHGRSRQVMRYWPPASTRMDIRCCQPASIEGQSGLLLGGCGDKGIPRLAWLRLRPRLDDQVSPLWDGQGEGVLRKLVFDVGRGLWAVDRDQGLLHRWRISPDAFRTGDAQVALQDHAIWLDTLSDLYILQQDTRDGALLVCAGEDGLVYALDADSGELRWTAGCGLSVKRAGYLTEWSDPRQPVTKGVWLLGGEFPDAALVDDGGAVRAIVEDMGPLSSVYTYQDGLHAFLCGLDGRVSLMTVPVEGAKILVQDSLEGEEQLVDWLHPMRSSGLETADGRRIATSLDNYYPRETRSSTGEESECFSPYAPKLREGLPVFALLRQVVRELLSRDDDTWFEGAFERFAVREEPHRLAWLLLGLLQEIAADAMDKNRRWRAMTRGLGLCEILWKGMKSRNGEEYICNLVGQILRFLETLRIEVTSCPPEPLPLVGEIGMEYRLKELLNDINRCLWWDPYPDDCPRSFSSETRLRELRVTQVTRWWGYLQMVNPIGRRLACLCESLSVLWWPERIDVLGWRLSGVVKAGLPMTAPRDRHWKAWLVSVVESPPNSDPGSPQQVKTQQKSDHSIFAVPDVLALLEQPALKPLTGKGAAQLKAVWGEDEAWQQWVDRLLEILAALDRDRRASLTPRAWNQWRLLVELLNHFAETGQSRFTRSNGYTLLELWWPRLVRVWRAEIEKERLALIGEFKQAPARFIEIVRIDDVWLDASKVDLRLTLVNYGPNDLRIEVTDAKGFTARQEQDLELVAGADAAVLGVHVETARKDRVEGELVLSCLNLFSGERLKRHCPVGRDRGLSRFTGEPQWKPTWTRLEQLLKSGRRPVWIDGNVLDTVERERLKKLVKDQFGIKVGKDLALKSRIASECLGEPLLFSPDLALGATGGSLVEQVHALLHNREGPVFDFLALAIWRLREMQTGFRGRSMPASVASALDDLIPSAQQAEELLDALFGDKEEPVVRGYFLRGLAALPDEGMGAWCLGEPLYGDTNIDIGSVSLEERYAAPATLFGGALWRRFDIAGVSEKDLAEWLGGELAEVRDQRRLRSALYTVCSEDRPERLGQPRPEGQRVAEGLLGTLGTTEVPSERLGVPYTELNIDLLYNHFERCYVLPPCLDPHGRSRFQGFPRGIWLCPQLPSPPSDLPGMAVALSEDQCLGLLHARSHKEARDMLNRVAATQHRIDSSLVFRIGGGMAELVCDHFEGRRDELETARKAVLDSDRKPEAFLIVGGRRMGKTSFKERLRADLSGKCKQGESERLFLSLDLQSFPTDSNVTPAYAEYRFFKLVTTFLKEKTAFPFSLDMYWSVSQQDSARQQEKTRDAFRAHLKKIKTKMGHVPVLILDETERFAQVDARHGFQTMLFLRELTYAEQICLIATSYPHGGGQIYSLQRLMQDSGTPHYNTITNTLYMRRWAPETAWTYLYYKLSGFGITLPLYLRDEVLRISRGVPWIVHLLGKEICRVSGATGPRRLISKRQWEKVRTAALATIREELRVTVEGRAEDADKEARVEFKRETKGRLADGRLWEALVKIARQYDPPLEWDPTEERSDFDKPLYTVTIDQLHELFEEKIERERIEDALNRLTASTVLEGDLQDRNRFYFANDLMPMVVQELKEGTE